MVCVCAGIARGSEVSTKYSIIVSASKKDLVNLCYTKYYKNDNHRP